MFREGDDIYLQWSPWVWSNCFLRQVKIHGLEITSAFWDLNQDICRDVHRYKDLLNVPSGIMSTGCQACFVFELRVSGRSVHARQYIVEFDLRFNSTCDKIFKQRGTALACILNSRCDVAGNSLGALPRETPDRIADVSTRPPSLSRITLLWYTQDSNVPRIRMSLRCLCPQLARKR